MDLKLLNRVFENDDEAICSDYLANLELGSRFNYSTKIAM